MTDEQQAREVYAQIVERMAVMGRYKANDIRAGNFAPEDERAIAAMLAFRAAQPGDAWANLRRIYDALPATGPRCRDCADEDGRCPTLKRPCDPTEYAIELIGQALATPPRRPALDREAVAAKAIAGALFEHISGKYGIRWEGADLPEEYQSRGQALEHLARLRADAILSLLPAEPVQEMREGEQIAESANCPSGDGAREDTKRIAFLADNSHDLRCFNVPTGGDDYDIGWRIVGHWQAEPQERVIAEVFHDDPRAAIDAARAALGPQDGGEA